MEAAAVPLPRPETTPPVTIIHLVFLEGVCSLELTEEDECRCGTFFLCGVFLVGIEKCSYKLYLKISYYYYLDVPVIAARTLRRCKTI